MIKLEHIEYQRGHKLLLKDSSLSIQKNWKVGVLGANGSGKSSLFSLLLGETMPQAGKVEIPSNWQIAHLRQETPSRDTPCIDYVLQGDPALTLLQKQLDQAQDPQQIADIHAELENIDGYTANTRAAKLLHGLGFKQQDHHRPIAEYSGGWRMRLNLAQTLMCRSQLLLLDEPTNHLDLDALLWLEQWLKSYQGTLLIISHDREFLDNVISHVIYIEHSNAAIYNGNYSSFEIQRAEKLDLENKVYQKQQKKIKHLQSFVDRFSAKASKAKQAQSRVKFINRLTASAPAHYSSPFQFEFKEPRQQASPLIKLDHVDLGYGDTTILKCQRVQIETDARIGILGPNGCGKSSLLKAMSGDLPIQSGQLWRHPNCEIAYFAQHQIDSLDLGDSPLQMFIRRFPKTSELELRKFLGGFGFQGEVVEQAIINFSGGEKARLTLAFMVFQRPNCLILDEPTNHLDIEMRQALTMALQSFQGAIIVVSHDRYLLQCVADEFLLISNQQVSQFNGDIQDYKLWLDEQNKENYSAEEVATNSLKSDRKEKRRQAAEHRESLKPLKRELAQLETQLEKLQLEKSHIEQRLTDSTLYDTNSKQQIIESQKSLSAINKEITSLEERWLNVSEEIETFNQPLNP